MAWWTDDTPLPDPHGRGERAVKFIELLKLHEGKLAGQRFKLSPWQRRIVQRIYGDTAEDGRRKIRTVFILLPRGNGKTTLCAGLGLLHLVGPEKEAGGQVVVAASDREQASIAYNAAAGMIAQEPALKKRTKVLPSYKTIKQESLRSTMRAISHEAYSKHGLSISCLIADEVHAWPKRELWDVLRGSMGKREEPLTIVITTAGSGTQGLAWELYDYAKKVADGTVVDDTFLPVLFEADKDADWLDEDVWRAVNPAVASGFRRIEEMRESARQAAEIPAQREAFKRYYLNMWSDGAPDPWLDMDVYDRCADPIDMAALEGRPCWLGVDLSSTQDLTAVVAAFAPARRCCAVDPSAPRRGRLPPSSAFRDRERQAPSLGRPLRNPRGRWWSNQDRLGRDAEALGDHRFQPARLPPHMGDLALSGQPRPDRSDGAGRLEERRDGHAVRPRQHLPPRRIHWRDMGEIRGPGTLGNPQTQAGSRLELCSEFPW